MWRLLCHYLFLISPFGASGRVCFVAFPGYLHLLFTVEPQWLEHLWDHGNSFET